MKMESVVSRISIPVDLSYIRPVTAYVAELARHIGFEEEEVGHIHLALEESLINVMKFGYEEETKEKIHVNFELQTTGLVIRIEEKGIPFNPDRLPEYRRNKADIDVSGPGLGLHLIKTYMDETAFIRKGRQGQEIRLTKHLKNKRINHLLPAEEKHEFHERAAAPARSDHSVEYSIRRMRPDEAVEVSKCAYKCYGYTYEDYIYFPERLAAMNEDGLLHSLVAVTRDDEIMGHAALKYPHAGASIAESGVAFIYPEYRKLGLFTEFNRLFIEHAESSGMHGLYGRAVTSHIASQRMAAGHGYKDCGVFLGVFPEEVDFKKIAGKTAQRESLVMSFHAFRTDDPRDIYLPENHRPLADRIFQSMGIPVRLPSESPNEDISLGDSASMEISRNHSLNIAEIIVHNYGNHCLDEIRTHLKTLCQERIDTIHVALNLEDPITEKMIGELESSGFRFACILPYGLDGRHAVFLQYLNNVKIEYDRIKLFTPEALMILEFIKDRIFTG